MGSDSDSLSKSPLLTKLFEAGIRVKPDIEVSGKYADVFPYYRGNPGFYHIFEGKGEAILLKGVFGDNIRIIKKGISLTGDDFSQIARFLFEVKKALNPVIDESYKLRLIITESEIFAVEAEECQFTVLTELDPHIPRPLTAGEYDSIESGSGSKTLYSRSFFRALFPEIASPYLQDLVERFPDILAYYFLAFDIKTPSPTIITAASRIYANISAISAGFEGAGIRRELFCCSYLPRQKVLFKESRNKPSLFLAKRITSQEIDTLLNEINSSIKNKGAYAIFNDDFYEELPRISFTALFLNFLFMEGFAYLKSLSELEDIEILRGIFASRKNSFFITGQRLQIPEFFDPAYPEANIEFTPPLAEVVSAEALFSKLSPFKRFLRREKIIRALNVMHSALDGRDKLLKIAAEFHKTTRSALLEHGRYIKSRKKFLDENHVFLFESADIRRLANDSYYSNIEPALEYKKNFIRRCAAQAAVYDIYEEDIKYFGLIAEKQTAQVSEGVKLSCLSLGGNEEIRGVCSTNPDEGELSCLKIPNLASLSCLKTPNALICDLAPLFSYVTEYCVINKIPLYYSVRFPELLSGKRLTLHKGDIEINVVNK